MVKYIVLSQGKTALVDDDDFEKLNKFSWHYHNGYAVRNTRLPDNKRATERMHRVIANTPDDLMTDHINGDTLDNRKRNLRNVTNSQNLMNSEKKKNAKSEFKGVTFSKSKKDAIGSWNARLNVNKSTVNIGRFKSEIEAAYAYNEAAIKYHKEYARINDIKLITAHDYQNLSSRTIEKGVNFDKQITNFSMGLSGEVGEVIDELKKVVFHGHELNIPELEKELGDVLWYVSAISTTLNLDIDKIMKLNIEKLKERYPEGFSKERSIQRQDKFNVVN